VEKVKYEVDPHNRLVVSKTAKNTSPLLFRQVLEGRFKVDKNSNLTYHIKAPLSKDKNIPHQIKLKGEWSLTPEHNLRFTLDKWGRQVSGDELTLQGEIIAVEKNSLVFALTTRTKQGNPSLYIFRLEGAWQADENNRITFRVKRGKDEYDILTFEGAWQIGKNYQIIYRYEKEQLARKTRKIQTLVFQGHWDIQDKARIAYVIDRNSNSVLNFKTGLGIFKDNYIKYEFAIARAHKQRPIRRVLILSGSWKIKQDKGLIFEVEYDKQKVYAIIFGAEASLTDRDTILFKLKDNLNKEIGAELELRHEILKGDGQAFLKMLKSAKESAIFAGAGFRW
jgi:hypothetical protein